jgi:hypothetical protein
LRARVVQQCAGAGDAVERAHALVKLLKLEVLLILAMQDRVASHRANLLAKPRRQQRHIYLEIMGSMPLKIILLTMVGTAVGCMVLSILQSKNLSELVGDDETCIIQIGKELCIDQFAPLNCTPPNSSVAVPPSNFIGSMSGISPFNRYFAIDTRFLAPNLNTTRSAQQLVYPELFYNMTVRGSADRTSTFDVVFEVKRQRSPRAYRPPLFVISHHAQLFVALLHRFNALPARNRIHYQLSSELFNVPR